MKPSARWWIIAAAAGGVVVLFVLLRPNAAPEDDASPTPATPATSPTTTESGSPTESPALQPIIIDVAFRNGEVQGPTRSTVRQGDRVQIVVRADVSDHVHLHGYDLMADVTPGQPARIEFVADVAGVFECELEDAGTLLFRLEIVP